MTRAEPTLAWIVSPDVGATHLGEDARARPAAAPDGAAAPGWGLGVSSVIHGGLALLVAAFWVAPELPDEAKPLEVLIVAADAPPPASVTPPAAPRGAEITIPPAAEPPPVDSASIAPPPPTPPPPSPPEERPAPAPAPTPEPPPAQAAKPPEPKPQPKPAPPKAAPPPQVASKPTPPVETAAPSIDSAAKKHDPVDLKPVPGVSGSGRNAELKALAAPKPAYPKIALDLREQGTVIVTMDIGTDGLPANVTLTQSSGFGSLDQAAMQAARKYRFQPPIRDGRPVTATVNIPFIFKYPANR
jgi:protein TonB